MILLSLDEAGDLLATASIEKTCDVGHAVIHTGTTEAGLRFTLMNDCHGQTALTYAG